MSKLSLPGWLERLEQVHPREIELGLDRSAAVAERLKLLRPSAPVVTVAGTNGKGSTVAVLEAVAAASGQVTGAYTSPHLSRFNERIRIAGEEVPDADIIDAFEAIDRARGDIPLTYFEFATLAALHVFARREPELILLEVGLGGRLDAVNIVDPTVAVITSIDLDHQEWLGDTRDAIAAEKAGILRAGVPAVIADPDPPARLLECLASAGAEPVLLIGRDFGYENLGNAWQGWLSAVGGRLELPAVPAGPLLPANVLAALQAAVLVGLDPSAIDVHETIATTRPAGRRQFLAVGGVDYVLDVAHNPAATGKLVDYLETRAATGKTIAVFSALRDKDIEGMIGRAAGAFDAWFVADQPHNGRAVDGATIAGLLDGAGVARVSQSRNLRQALARARSITTAGDRVVVFGSFGTVADALAVLSRDASKQAGADQTS